MKKTHLNALFPSDPARPEAVKRERALLPPAPEESHDDDTVAALSDSLLQRLVQAALQGDGCSLAAAEASRDELLAKFSLGAQKTPGGRNLRFGPRAMGGWLGMIDRHENTVPPPSAYAGPR